MFINGLSHLVMKGSETNLDGFAEEKTHQTSAFELCVERKKKIIVSIEKLRFTKDPVFSHFIV